MGGGAMPEQGGKGKKKSLDTVINVVPAIDLLSTLITFLLYTAVWTQVSRLQVQQLGEGAPQAEQAEQTRVILVTLAMSERGFNLQTSTGTNIDIPTLGRDQDGRIRFDVKALADRLKQLKAEFPEASSITVSAEDTVHYGGLVNVIDVAMGAGLVAVTVTGV